MKKNFILKGLLGAALGISIGHIVTVIISIFIYDGSFYSVTPHLIKITGSELNAVLLQTLLYCIMGGGFAMASIIWDIDSWSLAKQTGIYFTISCILMFPISYFAGWMAHTLTGIVLYVLTFVTIFIIIWIIQYVIWKNRIRKLNDKIRR